MEVSILDKNTQTSYHANDDDIFNKFPFKCYKRNKLLSQQSLECLLTEYSWVTTTTTIDELSILEMIIIHHLTCIW